MSRHDQPTNNVPLSGGEIAGFMNWRGPGAYTAHAERRVVRLIAEAVRREREACAKVCEALVSPSRLSDPGRSWITGTTDCAAAIRARGAE